MFITGGITLIAIAMAWIVCAKAHTIGMRLGVMDYPDVSGGRKRHDRPTPLVGGLAITAAIAIAGIAALAGDTYSAVQHSSIAVMLATALTFMVLGFADDRYELSPRARLLALLALTLALLWSEPDLNVSFLYFSFLPNAYFLGIWATAFTLLCLVGLANAVNMADGKNGLVISLSLFWSVSLIVFGAPPLRPLLLALAGALIVALVYNMRGKLFLGDAGSFGLSSFLGLATIYSFNQNFVSFPADLAVLFFLVPVMDCIRLMVSRVLRGKSPFSAGRDHLHHYISLMYGWEKGLFVYLGLAVVPTVLAMAVPALLPAMTLLTLCVYIYLIAAATQRSSLSSPEAA